MLKTGIFLSNGMLTHLSNSKKLQLKQGLVWSNKTDQKQGRMGAWCHICIYGKSMHSMLDKTMCIPVEYIRNTSFSLKYEYECWRLKWLSSGMTLHRKTGLKVYCALLFVELYNTIADYGWPAFWTVLISQIMSF